MMLLTFFLLATPCRAYYVGGGLTILSQNQLDNAINDRHSSAILVQQPQPFHAATFSCSLLGEVLWQPDIDAAATEAVITGLRYQEYQYNHSSQNYWVAKNIVAANTTAAECRSISADGMIANVSCTANLPALCTQTASASNATSPDDNSRVWRIVQPVNGTLVTGYRDQHVFKFLGLRYADKPERFSSSTEKTYQPGDADMLAVTSGADCPQPGHSATGFTSEDCLFANVWTPYLPSWRPIPGKGRPVMVLFHGGGFVTGSGSDPTADGTNFASRGDVVVVAFNYRLGNLGFLVIDDQMYPGNYALSDMVAALEWVSDYIRYFGGDPTRVTVLGTGAGAEAVDILQSVPRVRGLFSQAILQSDAIGEWTDGRFQKRQYTTFTRAELLTRTVLREANCAYQSDAKSARLCLSKLNATVLAALPTIAHRPVVDGIFVTSPSSSPASNITSLAGINRDEVAGFISVYPARDEPFADYFAASVGPVLGLETADARAFAHNLSTVYTVQTPPLATPETVFNATMTLATDAVYNCFNLARAYAVAAHNSTAPIYAFRFNRTYSLPLSELPCSTATPRDEYYKCNGGQQIVVLGNAARTGLPDRDGSDTSFSQLIVDTWSAFVHTGNPNPDPEYLRIRRYMSTLWQINSNAKWDPVDASRPSLRLLQWNSHQLAFDASERCAALGVSVSVPMEHVI